MTREEAIKIFNTVLFLGKCDCPKEEIEECLKMAIKALEQEPILDKIRAEIETKYGDCSLCEYYSDYGGSYEPIGDVAYILQIIDKYKAETEET